MSSTNQSEIDSFDLFVFWFGFSLKQNLNEVKKEISLSDLCTENTESVINKRLAHSIHFIK